MSEDGTPIRFEFIDLFAGIGGMRRGLELAHGRCVRTIEKDLHARRTYELNWGAPVEGSDVIHERAWRLPRYDLLAAGFPCQPFSIAGVVKKESLGRAHGFEDPISGNLFFQIIRLIGGPWQLDDDQLQEEASATAWQEGAFEEEGEGRAHNAAQRRYLPPVLLLENVRNLASHDGGRTLRVIRHRLMRTGYHVSERVISASHWVPQNRQRIFIVGLRRDLFGEPFDIPEHKGHPVGLKVEDLDKDPAVLEDHRLTPGVWAALQAHKARHLEASNGFGFGTAELGKPTRTLSARYYKDGAEILVPMPTDMVLPESEGTKGDRPTVPYRRLTHREAARLMGFVDPWVNEEFRFPPGYEAQAYKQLGNAVVVPQVAWLADEIMKTAGPVFEKRMHRRYPGTMASGSRAS